MSNEKEIFSSDEQLDLQDTKLVFDKKQGYSIFNIQKEKFFLVYTTSDYVNWTFINIFPYEATFNKINTIRYIIVLSFAVIFLATLYLGIGFVKGITKPILNLTARMESAANGEFGTDKPEASDKAEGDEISQLSNDFSKNGEQDQ